MSCSCGQAACSCAAPPLTGAGYAHTLAARLGPVVDCARALNVSMGLRPYTVTLVWTQWSGGKRGAGVEDVIKCLPLTPTPKVEDISSVHLDVRAAGVLESGSVHVSEISPRYDEDMLTGKHCGEDIARDQSFYWEIRFPRANGAAVRRRFRVQNVPNFLASKFQWHVTLQKVSEDRERSGEPRGT